MPPRPKPFVPVVKASTCQCIHHNPATCLAARHQASLQLAVILNGCACRCHFSRPGVEISHSQWQPIVNEPVAHNGWQRGPSEVK